MKEMVLRAAMPCLLVLTGCTSHVHYPLEARTMPVSRSPAISIFDYHGIDNSLTLQEAAGRTNGYVTRRFAMPASFENGQPDNLITGEYYASPSPGKRPLVIVLPVWGVSEYPSVKMAHAILRRSNGGMNVLRIDGERRIIDWKAIERSANLEEFVARVSNAARRLKHAVIDTRRLVDWAQSREEIARHRIGLVGFSISAVSGTLVAQSDPRIRSSALVMGGAEIGRIVSRCPGNEKETREAVMNRLNIDVLGYEQIINALFDGLDPADYPNQVDPRSILIVDADKDKCIPEQSREFWWEALGRPERITLNYSHRRAFLAMTPLGFNFLRRKVYQHLENTL